MMVSVHERGCAEIRVAMEVEGIVCVWETKLAALALSMMDGLSGIQGCNVETPKEDKIEFI